MFKSFITIIVIIISIYYYIKSKSERDKRLNRIKKLFMYTYQIKEHLSMVLNINNNYDKILEKDIIDMHRLNNIRDSLICKTHILSILCYLYFENSFDFIKNNPFINVALQKEDNKSIEKLLRQLYENNRRISFIHLSDEEIELINLMIKWN